MKISISISLILLFYTLPLRAQQALMACCNDTICVGDTVELTVSADSLITGNILQINDDTYSQIIDLGFDFTFFDSTYSQCVISTNGYINFDTSNTFEYSQWPIDYAAPSTNLPTNSIFGPYQDLDPTEPPYGSINYAVMGEPGSRKFVCTYCDVPMYNCEDSLSTQQIILYETTNVIEVHITKKRTCEFWNNEAAIEGIQNSTGATAYVVPSRNYPEVWYAENDAWRFTPNGASYDVAEITFNPIPILTGTPVWTNETEDSIGSGYLLQVTPEVTSEYIVRTTSSCGQFSDTVTITVDNCFPTGTNQNFESQIPQNALTTLYDETGKIVLTMNYSEVKEIEKTLPSGIYFLQVVYKEKLLFTKKLFLSR